MTLNTRQTTKPVHYPTMMVTGVASSLVVLFVFKFWLKPKLVRNQRLEGERCADTLLGPLGPAKQQADK